MTFSDCAGTFFSFSGDLVGVADPDDGPGDHSESEAVLGLRMVPNPIGQTS